MMHHDEANAASIAATTRALMRAYPQLRATPQLPTRDVDLAPQFLSLVTCVRDSLHGQVWCVPNRQAAYVLAACGALHKLETEENP